MGNEKKDIDVSSGYDQQNKKQSDDDDIQRSSSGKERVLQGKDQSVAVEEKVSAGSKRKSGEGTNSSSSGIAIKLCAKPKDNNETLVKVKKPSLSSIFNDDSDSEEEMPLECKMKMRNIGRDTTTSSGPKSFNKGKKGFSKNSFKVFELSMKPRNNMEKQTVFEDK